MNSTTIFEWKFWSDAWSNLDGIWICLRCHECLSICLRRTHFDRKWQCGGTGSEAYFCNFERFFSSNWILQQSLRAYHEKTDEARLMNFGHHIDSIILLCIAKFYNDWSKYMGVTAMRIKVWFLSFAVGRNSKIGFCNNLWQLTTKTWIGL